MIGLRDRLAAEERAALREQGPQWVQPMLATLTRERFSDPGWIYERKLDGERCLVLRDGRRVRLYSRNHRLLNRTYPELVEAVRAQPASRFVIDGEVVAFSGGRTSFRRLQARLGQQDPDAGERRAVRVYLYVFDLLQLQDSGLTGLALRSRKRLLREALSWDGTLRYCAHRNADGEAYYAKACRRGWEGIIAKRADSHYDAGRSHDWLKFKCDLRQEFVIGGYTAPKGSRAGFGALLLGYYEGDALRYAGKVGTGFDRDTLQSLSSELERHAREGTPYADEPEDATAAQRWVEPCLVAEVGFTEWTRDGRLRHPRFIGLRRDKDPGAVVREEPA